MKKIITYILLLIGMQVYAIEIENFQSGPACTDNKSFGWICHNTKDIYITGQGQCTWNGEEKPCTWYGFEFDYSGNEKEVTLECDYVMSELGDFGNPGEVVSSNSDKGSYSIKLKDESGHFYNPQYNILINRNKEKSLVKSHTVCKIDGVKLFDFGFNFHFPVSEG